MTDATENLPDPLVPAEVDLRGYEFMGLYGDRLFKSRTWIEASPEAKIAALRLWWQAYGHEFPAASLPDNDQLLAEYAGYGVAVKAWLKLKPQAMRGWRLCSDGRWYHPFVAELAMMAWGRRQSQRDRTEKARLARLLQNQLQEEKKSVTDNVTSSVTDSKGKERKGKEVKSNGAFAPPDWIPPQAWKDYVEMRNRIKKPMTHRAMELAVMDLGKLREKGYDPQDVIDSAVKNSYQGFWEPRGIQAAGQKRVAL